VVPPSQEREAPKMERSISNKELQNLAYDRVRSISQDSSEMDLNLAGLQVSGGGPTARE
jgi:hypothetical protein